MSHRYIFLVDFLNNLIEFCTSLVSISNKVVIQEKRCRAYEERKWFGVSWLFSRVLEFPLPRTMDLTDVVTSGLGLVGCFPGYSSFLCQELWI